MEGCVVLGGGPASHRSGAIGIRRRLGRSPTSWSRHHLLRHQPYPPSGVRNASLRLVDLGERRIISELLRARSGDINNFGDDEATLSKVPPQPGTLVATTDP